MTEDREEYRKELGRRLRRERSYRGLSQQRVDELTGISASRLSRIESGEVAVDFEVMCTLAALYDASLASLLEGLVPLDRDWSSRAWSNSEATARAA